MTLDSNLRSLKQVEPKEIPTGSYDLMCIKEQGNSLFSSIVFKEKESNPLSLRSILVRKLMSPSGLNVQFLAGKDLRNIIYNYKGNNSAGYGYITVNLDPNTCIGDLSVNWKHSSCHHLTGVVHKFYKDNLNLPHGNFGIMTLACSLIIEVIKSNSAIPVNILVGETKRQNITSILSRVHAPNLSERGYFTHQILAHPKNVDFFQLITYIYEPSTLAQIMRLPNYPKNPR